ncbi:MAG: SUMF1/EgtB/PvdO family nonheme iron enzyme, partial [Fibromonadaceae bacterium]|nr:SUMF1/EgtB/PvdO family nonheme iron enzyme [Fibromonadaceae bacterium]
MQNLRIIFALLVSAFAVNSFSQLTEVDAQIPVIVDVDANVEITPPIGWGTGEEANVIASTQRMLNVKLIQRPAPEDLSSTTISHQPHKVNTGVWVSHSRGNITLSLQSQQYRNAAISLYSINGKRVLTGKASANIPAGIYLLSVKGTNGNTFATKVTHGGGKLSINVAFSDVASPLLSSSMSMAEAEGEYGEWTITVTAPGYITQSRKFYPTLTGNPQQSFEMTAVKQTGLASFTETVNGVEFQMVYISGGAFKLGCEGSNCPPNTTAVDATVSPYFIGSTTVTRALWQTVMEGTTCTPPQWGQNTCPNAQSSHTWYDALEFACKLSQMTGRNYRMMTEAEFEYAAKNNPNNLTLTATEEWAYNTWNATHMGGVDPVGPGSGTHNQKTRRNAQFGNEFPTWNITGRLIRSIEGVGPALRLTLSANTDLPPDYIHPCELPAPVMGAEPVNSYRDPRWITDGNARWWSSSFGQNFGFMVWEDGTATMITTGWGGGSQTVTPGQWFTSNNYNFVFVPSNVTNTSPVRRYAYIFLNESVGTYLSPPAGNTGGVGSGRIEKEAVSNITKPVIANLMRGEDLAKSMEDFDTYYKMVDMVNPPTNQHDARLLDGPDHGWLQINQGSAHHYRKDIDPDEFRFVVSGT